MPGTSLLGTTNAAAMLAVHDLEAARRFYQDTLGLTQVDAHGDEVIVFRSGDTLLNVYRSQFAGTNQATALTWSLGDDFDDVIAELRQKGVAFEHYDMPDMTREGDVYRCGDMRAAWFKDPDGNILSVVSSQR
jgi:catechol 2,3-dioxygenase-like lactoylglutathione lyase family enzyme